MATKKTVSVLARNIAALRHSGNWTIAEFADKCGVGHHVIKEMGRRAAAPRAQNVKKIADACSLSVDDLYNEALADRLADGLTLYVTTSLAATQYVEVKTLDVRLGAGGGGSGEEDFIGEPDLLPIRLVEGELQGKASDFLLMEVEGTSMVPELLSGDRVLIDRRKTNPTQPGIFALFDGFGMVAKLVERVPRSDPPQLRILSRDPGLKPYQATLDEARIIGRIVWIARRV